jgi:hypothetical protein
MALELGKMLVCLEKSFLQDILGVFPVLGNILRQPEDIALVSFGKFCKRIRILRGELAPLHSSKTAGSGVMFNCIIHGPPSSPPVSNSPVDSVDDAGKIKLPGFVRLFERHPRSRHGMWQAPH